LHWFGWPQWTPISRRWRYDIQQIVDVGPHPTKRRSFKTVRCRTGTGEQIGEVCSLGVSVEFSPVDLLGELKQRIANPSVRKLMMQSLLDGFAGAMLPKPANARRQVCAHPLVTASDDEVSALNALIQRNVTESLSRVDEAEPQFAGLLNFADDLPNRQANTQVIYCRDEQPIATVINKRLSEESCDIGRRPFLMQDVLSQRNRRDSVGSAECPMLYRVLIGGPTEVGRQHISADSEHATRAQLYERKGSTRKKGRPSSGCAGQLLQ